MNIIITMFVADNILFGSFFLYFYCHSYYSFKFVWLLCSFLLGDLFLVERQCHFHSLVFLFNGQFSVPPFLFFVLFKSRKKRGFILVVTATVDFH